jgi:preprotein translocase subunit SecE
MTTRDTLQRPIERSRAFLEECLAELKKVHWPSREETRAATIAVLIGVAVMAVFLGVVDVLFQMIIQRVLS